MFFFVQMEKGGKEKAVGEWREGGKMGPDHRSYFFFRPRLRVLQTRRGGKKRNWRKKEGKRIGIAMVDILFPLIPSHWARGGEKGRRGLGKEREKN